MFSFLKRKKTKLTSPLESLDSQFEKLLMIKKGTEETIVCTRIIRELMSTIDELQEIIELHKLKAKKADEIIQLQIDYINLLKRQQVTISQN